ncbi:MAG: hypothetical protein ACRD2W_18630 [Acidimicrobiales bacterium]
MLRPIVPVSLVAGADHLAPSAALIDTGSESVLAAGWLADVLGVDLSANPDRVTVGIGGQVAEVTFVEVGLRLHAVHDVDEAVDWRADVGFVPGWPAPFPMVLGQVGFLDTFTVTLSRVAAMLAIEAADVFDARFGTGAPH